MTLASQTDQIDYIHNTVDNNL